MPPKQVPPGLGLPSFSCPHCGALSAQHWFKAYAKSFGAKETPTIYTWHDFQVAMQSEANPKIRLRFSQATERLQKNEVTFLIDEVATDSTWQMLNLQLSWCHACKGFSVWLRGSVIWPASFAEIEPHEDMPTDVRADFIEAASIVDLSPRGSAALSRLALQKLMVDLGEKGNNINDDIASLVEKGLETEIQRALDIVRVIGNNAVHPGQVDLKDDRGIAITLLQLVNLVVDRRIAAAKRLNEIYAALPPGALEQIQKRDGKKSGK